LPVAGGGRFARSHRCDARLAGPPPPPPPPPPHRSKRARGRQLARASQPFVLTDPAATFDRDRARSDTKALSGSTRTPRADCFRPNPRDSGLEQRGERPRASARAPSEPEPTRRLGDGPRDRAGPPPSRAAPAPRRDKGREKDAACSTGGHRVSRLDLDPVVVPKEQADSPPVGDHRRPG